MSSAAFDGPLRLDIEPSRQLLLSLLISHIGAVLLLWTLPGYHGLELVLALLITFSLIQSLKIHYWRNTKTAVTSLVWGDGEWVMIRADGSEERSLRFKMCFVHRQLVILNLVLCSGKIRSVVLFADSLDKASFRRLRVRLKFGAQGAQE